MLDSDMKSRYWNLSKNDMRELLGWMHITSLTMYRNDEGTVFDEQYYVFWEHYRFLKDVAKQRRILAYGADCPEGMRHQTFRQVVTRYLYPQAGLINSTFQSATSQNARESSDFRSKPGINQRFPNRSPHKIILLDRPLMRYFNIIRNFQGQEIQFLCSDCGGHLIISLKELGIRYLFLGIPVENWWKWKERPEYKGD